MLSTGADQRQWPYMGTCLGHAGPPKQGWAAKPLQESAEVRRRRRITRSMPATSMPVGGTGKRLNCTS